MAAFLSKEAVMAHPFRTGWLWAVIAVPLIAVVLMLTGIREFEWRDMPRIAALAVVAGPLFGLMLRWGYRREDKRAR
jgi:hypothetical protein